jgi:hypothetical protein
VFLVRQRMGIFEPHARHHPGVVESGLEGVP